jgi:hypothetical protein
MPIRSNPTHLSARLLCLALCTIATGCKPPETRVRVQSYQDPQSPREYVQQFDEAVFSNDARGRWDVLLVSRQPAREDPSRTVDQILHVRMFWRPVPGTTHVESSQTDALLTYGIHSGPTAMGYDGAGFASIKLSKDRQSLEGRIESSSLRPTRRRNEARDLFGPCRITGTFTATRNSGRATELLTELGTALGRREDGRPN